MEASIESSYQAAARAIRDADGLIITAGAGMGVDSGLPDFRGDAGFWRAYPALGQLGLSFTEVANPAVFATDPHLAWGFYGHRLNLYRNTIPHRGFQRLLEWGRSKPKSYWVFTSNVDGQFQKAGFAAERITECHGSIHHMQCTASCGAVIFDASDFVPEVDAARCRLTSDLPRCPHCGAMARPNILMFGDWMWESRRTDEQARRMRSWLAGLERPVVIELGAGAAITTVRRFGEALSGVMIRVNPRESKIARPIDIGLATGALEGLEGIARSKSALDDD